VKPVRIDPEARQEFLAAVDRYTARDGAVAVRFVAVIDRAPSRIRAEPRTLPLVRDVPPAMGGRAVLVERFPYSVVFLEFDSEIRILAFAHGRRQPGYWKDRADSSESG
jgi:plasmid stabilization system protein ParE